MEIPLPKPTSLPWYLRPALLKKLGGVIALASFLLPLLLYCVVGLSTRYVADDYETAGSLNKYGFWGSQQYWYLNWSGRYAYFFIANLFELLGVQAAPFLTGICLVLWTLVLAWLLHRLLRSQPVQHPVYLSILGATLALVITLRSMDHIHQILFWVTGILTYPLYLILLTAWAGWIITRLLLPARSPNRLVEAVLFSSLAFAMTGISEMSASLQLLVAALLALYAWRLRPEQPHRQVTRLVSLAVLLATLAGFILLFTAPGNAVRTALQPPRPDLLSLAWRANLNTLEFIGGWLAGSTLLAGAAFLLPALIAFALSRPAAAPGARNRRARSILRSLVIPLALLYLALLSQFAAAFYALNALPPDRALVIPQYFLTLALMFLGYRAGISLKGALHPRPIPAALNLICVLILGLALLAVPLRASLYNYSMIAPARERAVEWDERDRIIRQAIQDGEKNVVVWYIKDFNRLGDYSSDPAFLVNRAAADYYGLETIIALDQRP